MMFYLVMICLPVLHKNVDASTLTTNNGIIYYDQVQDILYFGPDLKRKFLGTFGSFLVDIMIILKQDIR